MTRKKITARSEDDYSDEELEAIANSDQKGGLRVHQEEEAQSPALSRGVVRVEVVPQPNDPAFVPAIILRLIDNQGDVDKTLRQMGCTFGDYLAVSTTAEFKTAYDNIVKAKVDIPNRLAMRLALTEKAKDGDGYVAKVLHDTRQGDSASEEEQRALSELRVADRAMLARQLEAGAKRLIGMLEVVRGRRYALVEQDPSGQDAVVIEPTTADLAADIAADVAQPYIEDDSPSDGE